ncbi:hypothetical protein WMY93_005668 [Mugilogobius chulae]|uniref:Vav guanine nucleotide exchange factor 1 n=1 Tax=Mugilogobius chulae TaxID=88201 RepID=A0AAW0PHF5_9GOBI
MARGPVLGPGPARLKQREVGRNPSVEGPGPQYQGPSELQTLTLEQQQQQTHSPEHVNRKEQYKEEKEDRMYRSKMELWRQCAQWLIDCRVLPENHRVTLDAAQVCDLAQALRDGVLLCQLLNNLMPHSVNLREINLRPQMSQFLCLKNIRTFLGACHDKFHLKKSELFEAFDLFDVRDFERSVCGAVLNTLSLLSRSSIAVQRGFQPFPLGGCTADDDIYSGLSDQIDDTVEEDDDLYDCVEDEEMEGDEIYEDLMRREEPPETQKTGVDKRECCLKEIGQTEEKYSETLQSILQRGKSKSSPKSKRDKSESSPKSKRDKSKSSLKSKRDKSKSSLKSKRDKSKSNLKSKRDKSKSIKERQVQVKSQVKERLVQVKSQVKERQVQVKSQVKERQVQVKSQFKERQVQVKSQVKERQVQVKYQVKERQVQVKSQVKERQVQIKSQVKEDKSKSSPKSKRDKSKSSPKSKKDKSKSNLKSKETSPSQVSSQRETSPSQVSSQRETSPSQISSQRETSPSLVSSQRETSPNQVTSQRETSLSQVPSQRETSPSLVSSQRETSPSQVPSQRETSPSQVSSQREISPSQVPSQRETSPSQVPSQRETSPSQVPSQRETSPSQRDKSKSSPKSKRDKSKSSPKSKKDKSKSNLKSKRDKSKSSPKSKRDKSSFKPLVSEPQIRAVQLQAHFMRPLLRFLQEQDIESIFINIEDLAETHRNLLEQIQTSISDFGAKTLHQVFLNNKERLLLYGRYCSQVEAATKHVDMLSSTREDIRMKLEECSKRANSGRFSLRDLLMVPMQRVLKYHLLLQELMKHTTDATDKDNLRTALDAMRDLAQCVNEVKRDNEIIKQITSFQLSIENLSESLALYGRPKIDGELKISSTERKSKQDRYAFLFDKALFVCKKKNNETFELKETIDLQHYQIRDESAGERDNKKWSYLFLLLDCYGRGGYDLYFKTRELKKKWLEQFEMAISNMCPDNATANNHDFQMYCFEETTSCRACAMLLRGIFFQGYQCTRCKMAAHKECLGRMPVCGRNSGTLLQIQFSQLIKLKIPKSSSSFGLMSFRSQTSNPAVHSTGYPKMEASQDYFGLPPPPVGFGSALPLSRGDVVELTKAEANMQWWEGRNLTSGQMGWFPNNKVQPYRLVSFCMHRLTTAMSIMGEKLAEMQAFSLSAANTLIISSPEGRNTLQNASNSSKNSTQFNMDTRHIRITSSDGLFRINDKKAFKGLPVRDMTAAHVLLLLLLRTTHTHIHLCTVPPGAHRLLPTQLSEGVFQRGGHGSEDGL